MWLNKSFIRVNKLSLSVVLFLFLFSIIHIAKPSLLYTKEGGFRQFGVGYKQKTVIPIWIVAIMLAILSYVLMSYWGLSIPKPSV